METEENILKGYTQARLIRLVIKKQELIKELEANNNRLIDKYTIKADTLTQVMSYPELDDAGANKAAACRRFVMEFISDLNLYLINKGNINN